jgi:DinB superfamily
MDRCDECGFVYTDHSSAGVVNDLASLAPRYGERLRTAPGETRRAELLRRRPRPDVWSALEYACHVRDVLLAQRERTFLALVEDCPSFAPIYRNERVSLARYTAEDPDRVATQIDVALDLLNHALVGMDGAGWRRQCVYNFPVPSERSILWLAQHTLHEGEHHLLDIDRSIAGP